MFDAAGRLPLPSLVNELETIGTPQTPSDEPGYTGWAKLTKIRLASAPVVPFTGGESFNVDHKLRNVGIDLLVSSTTVDSRWYIEHPQVHREKGYCIPV